MIPEFFTVNPDWRAQIETIVGTLGRIGVFEERSARTIELRRAHRIGSVHSSTAIEGNPLSADQVAAIEQNEPVWAPPREMLEVRNAFSAYDALNELDPWNVDDFLKAHALLTNGLIGESGTFRTVEVDIVGAQGDVLHSGSRSAKVPRLIGELFQWGSSSTSHPVVVSSAVHFLIEHIHPFRDGNGRIGRLWQTLILSRWRSLFAWIPTETLIRRNQQGYYDALQRSREPEIDAATFIDFMIGVIGDSVAEYEERARTNAVNVGVNVGVNDGVNAQILVLLRENPQLTADALAVTVNRSRRTIERRLKMLREAGAIRREGSSKTGIWVVID